MSIIIFLLVLGLLIFVHELGHFIVAKKSGVKVYEFALGFPPTLFKYKKGETTYKLNLLPFGGYVNLEGENGPAEEKSETNKKTENKTDNIEPGSFASKGPVIKTLILAAGVIMNMLLAWVLLSICFMIGYPTIGTEDVNPKYIQSAEVLIMETLPDSPAFTAGLLPEDVILSLSDDARQTPITKSSQVKDFIESTEDDEVTVTVKRKGEEKSFTVLTSSDLAGEMGEEDGGDRKMIGVSTVDTSLVRFPAHLAFIRGAEWTVNATRDVAGGLGKLVRDAIRGKADMSSVAGPVGIVNMVGDAYSVGFVYLLSFTAIISINLAVINLLPIPALDGGRILFTWIEAIKGSPIKMKTQLVANGIGFGLLILLMLFITVNDVIKLFN